MWLYFDLRVNNKTFYLSETLMNEQSLTGEITPVPKFALEENDEIFTLKKN